jgi:hypothetical protein
MRGRKVEQPRPNLKAARSRYVNARGNHSQSHVCDGKAAN